MKDAEQIAVVVAGIILIAVGIGSFWFPAGSSLGPIAPGIAACVGALLWWYSRTL